MSHNLLWASDYYLNKFGSRVQKIPIDAGFTCPNRDGSLSFEGCVYCNNESFSPFYATANCSINEQLKKGIDFFAKKYNTRRYFAYFQSFSNTYAPISVLQKKYREALSQADCEGLVIATRPDCINAENLALLKDLSQSTYIKLEIGVESFDDEVLKAINRQHDSQTSIKALEQIGQMGIDLGVHLIFGLPIETSDAAEVAAQILSESPCKFVKLHHLQIIAGSSLARHYKEGPLAFSLLNIEEYIEKLQSFVQALQRPLYFERLINRVPPDLLIAPKWGKITEIEMRELLCKRLN